MKRWPWRLVRVLVFLLSFILMGVVYLLSFSRIGDLVIIFGGVVLTVPVVWLGRVMLDRQPDPARTEQVTVFVHFGLLTLLGAAIFKAVQTYALWNPWVLPIPEAIGEGLVILTMIAIAFTMLNLAVKGLGAPFAVALTRRLTGDWLYAWTRNPMVLATLGFLVALGLWLRSGTFVAWAICVVSPAWVFFLKAYEEKELEIRFGAAYLNYKAKTAFLFPRKPKK